LAVLISKSFADDFDCSVDGYFADPKNCIKYYHCFNGTVEDHKTCQKENGQQLCYDPGHNWCDFPSKVDCGDRPICDENDENCNTQTTIIPTTTKPDFDCPEISGYYADPKNCIKYYHCYEGAVQEHITCPHDSAGKQELYDENNVWCDHADRVDCGNRPICDENDENCDDRSTSIPKTTTPIPDFDCPQANGYFPDPNNCIKYFHCYENVAEQHLTCPKVDGKQECFDEFNSWCDWPERVDCGNRPICDENDENCNTPTTKVVPTGPTTTPKEDNCAKYGTCVSDGFGPYHSEGPCEQCYCQCILEGYYVEECCQEGLVFNDKINQCDWPYNVPDCN